MAVRPGEENVATLFGDIHYFYSPETERPRHHRFDKGSYVYLFENANERRARVEIANHPGSDDQDAFDGFLDNVHVHYSYKHHCTVSLVVNDVPNQEEWHLPTYDPRNENMYHYKLHSLDIYFWTQQDALQFVNGVRRVLPAIQVEVLDEPAPPPLPSVADMSSVVQKLEKAALSSDNHYAQRPNGVPSFAPPPLSAVSAELSSTPPQSYAPIAYNPAAPPAPEAIAPRDKTPPPDDGEVNPLHLRLVADAATPFSPGLVPSGPSTLSPLSPGVPPPSFLASPSVPSFPGPPQQSVTSPGLPPAGFATHPGLARSTTMPLTPASPFSAFPGSPGYVPPTQLGLPQPPPPPPPTGGYSNYSYGSPQAGAGAPNYSVHQQLYRPTEGEASVKYTDKKEPRGKLEENAGRLERGVTGMLKKFEKKFG